MSLRVVATLLILSAVCSTAVTARSTPIVADLEASRTALAVPNNPGSGSLIVETVLDDDFVLSVYLSWRELSLARELDFFLSFEIAVNDFWICRISLAERYIPCRLASFLVAFLAKDSESFPIDVEAWPCFLVSGRAIQSFLAPSLRNEGSVVEGEFEGGEGM